MPARDRIGPDASKVVFVQEIFYTPIVVIHVVACAFLVLVVLLQPGKSGGLGALSGAGAQQVFGGRGAGNILTRITWITAATFFITSVTLAFLSSSGDDSMRKRDVEIGVIDEAPIKVPTAKDKAAKDKAAKDKAKKQQSSDQDEPKNATSSEPKSEDNENDLEENATPEAPKPEGPTGSPSSPTTAKPQPAAPAPAAPKPAAPAAPKPAAPAPATPQPAAPAPVTPKPAVPAPATPQPAAPAPAPGDAPY